MLCHHGGFRTYDGGSSLEGRGAVWWVRKAGRTASLGWHLLCHFLLSSFSGALEAEEGAGGGLASLKWGEKGSGGVSEGPTRWRCRPSFGAGGTQSCCQVTPGASPAPGLWVSQSGRLVKVRIPGLSRSGLGRKKLHL